MIRINFLKINIVITFLLVIASGIISAQVQTLDEFETKDGWNFIRSDGVNLNLSTEPGLSGNAIRFDYDLTKGTGYGGFQKLFPIDLPENYEFTFYIKADSPANNFEIKFIDSTGNNVWWVNNRNYDFPGEWKKIRIKKRHINFAWGPTTDQNLTRIDRIEFTIASYVGGKGTIWIDDLKFEPLPAEKEFYPVPSITASSLLINHSPDLMADNSDETYWKSKGVMDQNILVDFKTRRELGGLQINWLPGFRAISFDILISEDSNIWEKVYTVEGNGSDVSFIRLPEAEAKYLKINFTKPHSEIGYGISELKFLDIKSSLTRNDFSIYTAENSPVGDYPRYFLEQASYWTITGVNNDLKEGLINEDGMVEVDKGHFSIEPMIRIRDSLYNWSNVKSEQSLGFKKSVEDFMFVPTVTWLCGDLKFIIEVTSSGDANVNSELDIRYSFQNLSGKPVDFDFYLLIRPFQVNPYYQWLNLSGGTGKINVITEDPNFHPGKTINVDEKFVISTIPYDDFTAGTFDNGNVVDMLRQDSMPVKKEVIDQNGLAYGVIKYSFHMDPGDYDGLMLMVPNYEIDWIDRKLSSRGMICDEFSETNEFWETKVDHIKFNLPESADRIVNTHKANLIYILINRDKAGIQPGSRSYERSWIRDGALTSSALLKSGIVEEVKDFIDWYTDYQFENGKVPCVVDSRGPDPVPENDSLRAFYGLVPESISHEGYSAKPMHSYWDDFFTMKGLKDAAEIQKILGEEDNYERIVKIRDTFKENLYNSLELAMKNRNIDYIPGCVELGDFDATSTTIALHPCNELKNLPKPQVYNTFNRYYEFFKNRRDGDLDWVNYTPYENRLIGSFILLDEPQRAHELIEFFLHDQRPQGWNHWAEVVWKDYRRPGFIGDMPHTWVGSDFINAIRSMFVYENEYDKSLVVAAALYQDWIDAPGGMTVEHLPTYYGEISYSIKKEEDTYIFSIYGDVELPANGIKIRNFNGSKMPAKVMLNGTEIKDFSESEIAVNVFPAEVLIFYQDQK